MTQNCTHDCSTCGVEGCGERTPESLIQQPHKDSHIRKVIGIVSGKGGVGKSSVSSLAAVTAKNLGYSVGIMDADVTGPSIPAMFGVTGGAYGDQEGINPAETRRRIKLISTNLLLERPEDPVVWRGPVIAGLVTQFWTDVKWGETDCLFIDMPPGTGDVPLTVFQSIPIDGIIIVTSPQDLVSMIVGKAVRMAELMDIPVLGVVENMSYMKCPHCGEKIKIFGDSQVNDVAAEHGLKVIEQLPLDPELAVKCDRGEIESYDTSGLEGLQAMLDELLQQTI